MDVPDFQDRMARAQAALRFLEKHRLDPSADHYRLALGYVTGSEPALIQAIDREIDGGLRLTEEAAAALLGQLPVGDARNALHHQRATMSAQADQLGSLTSEAHDVTAALGRDVDAMVTQGGDRPGEASVFAARLAAAEGELSSLRHEVAMLSHQIRAGEGGDRDPDRDALTQALSREAGEAVIRALAGAERSYLMILFVLDDLIGVNERYGRAVGDNVLAALSATVRHRFPDDPPIRWSGNEIVLATSRMSHVTARAAAEAAVEEFAGRRLKLRGSGEWIGTVTASAALTVGRSEPIDGVLTRVREKAASATAAGGNRVEG